ncbi:MAG TPA: SDR family NAD(P)-dependent oxidoreductase [Alphaproteobacteria bacterium]|jgi:NAD(P)-dependent dehydrogenase (short-subunit alcohol dehydrogenase family)
MQPIPATKDASKPIRLDGRVALITGAGRGLGRAYALELAARGAAVIVNDPGLNLRGDDAGDRAPAEAVVAEIRRSGGRAVADFGSVSDSAAAEAMVRRAVDEFGGLDIVVNNAGNNRRSVFAEIDPTDFASVLDVHLTGTFRVTRAAWPVMAARGYGRIIFTTSQVGFYGKIDSVSYGAAKAGIIGLMHGLRLSAEPAGIKVNCISPFALTRMGDIFPTEIAALIDPAQVAAAVAFLASADCPLSGEILIAGGGHFALARTLETRGIDIDDPKQVSAEAIRARIGEIGDFAKPLIYADALKAVGATFDRVKRLVGLG